MREVELKSVVADPDTVIATSHGQHFLVREPVEAVVARVVSVRRQIQHGPLVVESAPKVEG